nr:TOPRIM nucleotidyl transferase/hydrolase domain-containing protein [Ferrimicrobium acidiphilum]
MTFDHGEDETSINNENELIRHFLLAFTASNVYARLQTLRPNDTEQNTALAYETGRSWADSHSQDVFSSGAFLLIIHRNPALGTRLGFEFSYNLHKYTLSLNDDHIYYDEDTFAIQPQISSVIQPFEVGVSQQDDKELLIDLPFANFLPTKPTESCSWALARDTSGRALEPWFKGLQGTFGFRLTSATSYSVAEVLTQLYTTKVMATENLRKPARRSYPAPWLMDSHPITDAEMIPLRLLQMKDHSNQYYQDQFLAVQQTFRKLTGHDFGVAASYVTTDPGPASSDHSVAAQLQVIIDVFVREDLRQAHIDRAGAGIWESLFLATMLHQGSGVVTFLDEPAVTMHPTLQRKVLQLLKQSNQTIITTHSPYLVPSGDPEDRKRIVRLYKSGGATQRQHLDGDSDVATSRLDQIHTQPEARSMLFSSGVILVEGDTETGAFHTWFNDPIITDYNGTLDDNNFQMVSVGGDKSFGGFVTYLEAFAIPWAIICDGPVMSPSYEKPLTNQLPVRKKNDNEPDGDASFDDWKEYWKSRRVFTVASEFGLRSTDEVASKCETCGRTIDSKKTKAGEIEAFFEKMNAELWKCACDKNPASKVRQGSYFAQHIKFNTPSAELTTLKLIYSEVVKTLPQT